jgi:hypothetical protein
MVVAGRGEFPNAPQRAGPAADQLVATTGPYYRQPHPFFYGTATGPRGDADDMPYDGTGVTRLFPDESRSPMRSSWPHFDFDATNPPGGLIKHRAARLGDVQHTRLCALQ